MSNSNGMGGQGRRLKASVLGVAALMVLVFCGLALTSTRADDAPLRVVATIAMIGEPLARIAGPHVAVDTIMGEGVDPHLYRPTRSDITRLTRADAIVYNGLALEAQLLRPIERLGQRVPTLAVAEAIDNADYLPYDGGPGDPHVWMDPALWRQALEAAVAFLMALDPDHADSFRANADAYFKELEALNAYAAEVLSTIPQGRRLLVTAHDAFSYFGARFAIDVRGIQGISTESEAGLKAIEDLVDLIVERAVPAVFVETSVTERQVRALIDGAGARGHRVTVGGRLFSDAMGPPGSHEGTYLGMIDHNVTVIARALGGTADAGGAFGRLTLGQKDQ